MAKKIYEGIQDGKSAYDLITKDADVVAVEIALDAGSQLNPTIKAAKALHDFSENAKAMSELQSNLAEGRNEFKLQMDNLSAKIDALDDQLKKIQSADEASKIDDLFQTYQSVRKMCADNRR